TRKLKDAGIECFTVQERSVSAGPSPQKHFAAIKVQVRSSDVTRAIHQMQAKPESTLSAASGGSATAPRKRGVIWLKSKAGGVLIAAGLVLMIALGLALLMLL